MELPAPRRGGARRGNGAIALAAAAVVAVSAVFALGLALGQRKEQGAAAVAPRAAPDPLAALDAERPPQLPTPTQASYVFHDALTKDRPPDTLAQVGHAPKAGAAKPGTAVTTARVASPAPAPAAKPTVAAPAATPAPAPAPAPAARPAAPAVASKPPPPAAAAPRARPWTIQLVSTPKESEAQKLASRHPGARVVPAEVDGKRWYRVQLGSFDSRAVAQAELPRVAAPGAFVTMR